MKFELLLAIIILIAIAITCLTITIWKVFITKKRTTFSATDFLFGMILGILAGATANSYIFVITMAVLSLWLVMIGVKTKENQREMEKKEMEQRNIQRYKKKAR